MSYVYIRTEPRLWTVGFYRPDGKFETDSDHGSSSEAAGRVAYLNGGPDARLRETVNVYGELIDELRNKVYALERDTPQARQLQYEADVAAADLAESGYAEDW